jgi:hypothetical protein
MHGNGLALQPKKSQHNQKMTKRFKMGYTCNYLLLWLRRTGLIIITNERNTRYPLKARIHAKGC